jgi:hypothetical protein
MGHVITGSRSHFSSDVGITDYWKLNGKSLKKRPLAKHSNFITILSAAPELL